MAVLNYIVRGGAARQVRHAEAVGQRGHDGGEEKGKEAISSTQSFTKCTQILTEKAFMRFARSAILISPCNSV